MKAYVKNKSRNSQRQGNAKDNIELFHQFHSQLRYEIYRNNHVFVYPLQTEINEESKLILTHPFIQLKIEPKEDTQIHRYKLIQEYATNERIHCC